MNQPTVLELRLHSGAHAGAHETLQDGTYLLGSGSDCDFVLGDVGILAHHARLELGLEGWQLRCWKEDGAASADLRDLIPGTLYVTGPLALSINQIQSPWPSADELNALLKTTSTSRLPAQDESTRDEAELDNALKAPNVTFPPLEKPAASAAAQSTTNLTSIPSDVKRGGARHTIPIILGVFVSVIAAGLVWVLGPDLGKPEETLATSSTSPHTKQGKEAVNQIIKTLGLGARVIVVDGPDGLPSVNASLLSEVEYESLAMALSQLTPRPGLTATTEQDLIIILRELLALQALEFKTVLSSKHLGGGSFQIEGNMENANARNALMSYLSNTLPAVVSLKSALTVSEDLAQNMLTELQEAGLFKVNGVWTEGRLRLNIRLTAGQVSQWEQLLTKVARKHGVPFTATLNLTPDRSYPGAFATLPFRLKAIVGGEAPYVVLDSNDKILLEGRSQGWQLMSISSDSVVFENSKTGRVVVDR